MNRWFKDGFVHVYINGFWYAEKMCFILKIILLASVNKSHSVIMNRRVSELANNFCIYVFAQEGGDVF